MANNAKLVKLACCELSQQITESGYRKMSKAVVTAGQARSLVGSFTVDTPWEGLEADVQPFIELTPVERGERFAAWIRNGCRLMIGEPKKIKLDHAHPFNPAEFIGNKGWTTWLGPADGDGLSGEPDQDSREQKEAGHIRLGGATFLALWLDYQANKENSVLGWLYRTRKIAYLDFMGLVLRDPDGSRYVLCLDRRGDGSWLWYCSWLALDWESKHCSAGLANSPKA
ncbi:MAG: hypothetical protein NTY66_01405 [Candidatus Vogelbacteria bacterium]|nr:hypothetical protein [Candidatus Vogelbacteria bacterium]